MGECTYCLLESETAYTDENGFSVCEDCRCIICNGAHETPEAFDACAADKKGPLYAD